MDSVMEMILGQQQQKIKLRSLENCCKKKFDTRRIGMIGAAKHLYKELEVLLRSVRVINDELMEIEADQKHVPRLLEDLGLMSFKLRE